MELVLSIIVGLIIGPFIYLYCNKASDIIHKRDLEYNQKAIENGEEIIELPDGINLYKIPALTMIIICLLSGLLWGLLEFFFGFSFAFIINGLTASVLLAISIVDFQVFEIPIECNVIILVLGIINLILDSANWLQYAIGFGAVSLIFVIISFVTAGKGMGGGDIKLMATLGLLLGWKNILLVMVLGCVLGSVIHISAMIIFKKKSVLAFGPYLSAAAVITMLYGNVIIDWYLGMLIPN